MVLSKLFQKAVSIGAAGDQQAEDTRPDCGCQHALPARPEFLLQQQQQQQQNSNQNPMDQNAVVVHDRQMARATQAVLPTSAQFPKAVICYYTSWSIYARRFMAPSIPIEQMTHLLYGTPYMCLIII